MMQNNTPTPMNFVTNVDTHFTSVLKIQKWWKKHTSMFKLRRVKNYLETALSSQDLQSISDCCYTISQKCKGDGGGLLAGSLIDMYLSEMLSEKLSLYEGHHEGESDMKICNLPLSLKKITGKSTIALNWSKNGEQSPQIKTTHFTSDIMLVNLKTEKWWKKGPTGEKNVKIYYDNEVEAGIYLIDKQYCKKNICITSNNKTDTLIDHKNLYIMINRSLLQNLFIRIPPPKNVTHFNILKAFH
jgi:hypothetical protein